MSIERTDIEQALDILGPGTRLDVLGENAELLRYAESEITAQHSERRLRVRCRASAYRTRSIVVAQPHTSERKVWLCRHGSDDCGQNSIERVLLGKREQDRRQQRQFHGNSASFRDSIGRSRESGFFMTLRSR